MEEREYIHGYSPEEQQRLIQQGETLAEFVFDGLDFSDVNRLLEVGSGVGGQTAILLREYPRLCITGLEVESKQVSAAREYLASLPYARGRYQFIQADATRPDLSLDSTHDAALFIWVLEHITQPMDALVNAKKLVRQGGKVFAVEVFHSSLHLYPHCPNTMEYWRRSLDFQRSIGGDADIGQRMGNLFHDAGFEDIHIRAYPMHFGKYAPTKRSKMLAYWYDLMKSALPAMISAGYADEALWVAVATEMQDLQGNDETVFYYSFVKIEGTVP
jgi:ubiquinone/menaquinone biosynthesis C-methylase UbiE